MVCRHVQKMAQAWDARTDRLTGVTHKRPPRATLTRNKFCTSHSLHNVCLSLTIPPGPPWSRFATNDAEAIKMANCSSPAGMGWKEG